MKTIELRKNFKKEEEAMDRSFIHDMKLTEEAFKIGAIDAHAYLRMCNLYIKHLTK